MSNHECKTHEQWLQSVHYMCSCGHVEWAHYGKDRLNKGRCAHCNCTRYNGEVRPLTNYEKEQTDGTSNRQDTCGNVQLGLWSSLTGEPVLQEGAEERREAQGREGLT